MLRPRFHLLAFAILLSLSLLPAARATVFSQLQGVVHDPQHRPVADAHIAFKAAHSQFSQTAETGPDGAFALASVPLGEYIVTVTHAGFATLEQAVSVASNTSPVLHFELQLGSVTTIVTVSTETTSAADTVTPTTMVNRLDIAETPGADRTRSMAAITQFVPGAYMTHDQLHIRGGHQVSWLIDGVEIPNTNIGSNLGAQIDPKDIDYLEVQRGSYAADVGDRTYGAFNVVPRTGFERNREGELLLSAGSFLQTDDQLNLGDHSERLAWYASLSGSRSDYGLAAPVKSIRHDAANGTGGFGSLLWNRTAKDQFRMIAQLRHDFFQVPYDPDPASVENQQHDSSGLRDSQSESDQLAVLSWIHTYGTRTVLQASPFFHRNSASYRPGPHDAPVATTSERTSSYAGGQGSFTTEMARNAVQAGIYFFGQRDGYLFGADFSDGSRESFRLPQSAAAEVVEEYVSDTYKATHLLTLMAGVRMTQFRGDGNESSTAPRFGASFQVPKLGWVFRAFYGRFYQPPPLLTASGPLVQYAQASDTAFTRLYGERDEEHQFGLQIPYRGWVLDVDTFKNRVNNFLDHSNVGESSLYFPVSIDGALVRAWEVTVRSPKMGRLGQAHLAYSNQIATQRGAIKGGLICAPAGSPQCDAGFSYKPVDHDQRNTLNAGLTALLPRGVTATAELAFGSGFVNGGFSPEGPPVDPRFPSAYLPPHTSFDLRLGRSFGSRVTASVTATNVANQRVLLDNSLTFGGFHYSDPREIFAQVRYRFRF
ncbi:MAG: hypothetical protein NVSMB62_20290 [Acidobacteriaceae bacterium]